MAFPDQVEASEEPRPVGGIVAPPNVIVRSDSTTVVLEA